MGIPRRAGRLGRGVDFESQPNTLQLRIEGVGALPTATDLTVVATCTVGLGRQRAMASWMDG
jgi:hypothetical protein